MINLLLNGFISIIGAIAITIAFGLLISIDMLFDSYGKWLSNLYNHYPKLAKPIGACATCTSAWICAVSFIIINGLPTTLIEGLILIMSVSMTMAVINKMDI